MDNFVCDWRRGCFAATSFFPSSHLPIFERWELLEEFINPWFSFASNSKVISAPRVQVPHDFWNAYWLCYSTQCGNNVEELLPLVSGEEEKGCASSMTLRSRRVDIFLCDRKEKTLEEVSSDSQEKLEELEVLHVPLDVSQSNDQSASSKENHRTRLRALVTLTVFYARRCGAVENVFFPSDISSCFEPRGDLFLCSLLFSTEDAAVMFELWLSSSARLDFFWNAFLSDLRMLNFCCSEGMPSNLFSLNSWKTGRLVGTRVVEDKESFQHNFTQLVLGPNIFLPSVYVRSLFCDMLSATAVRFERSSNSFVISFKDKLAARLALHGLQYSFWIIFGLTLCPAI